jgi:putative transposase
LWSSAAAHTGRPDPPHLLDLEAWNDLVRGVNWKEMLTEGDDKETLAALRLHTQTRRPLARDSFLSKLEHTLGRRLRPLPVGRPRKQKPETRKKRK